ncbi:MAG: DUF4926 domain-containing protein [Zetaproteobacteria bacterium]|nr:MAG: DUF4926 domain-containing protein [Zetaproteobacteria bacterium]
MMKEHERVVLRSPVPAERLEAGDVGTVVHVYPRTFLITLPCTSVSRRSRPLW